MKSAMHGVLWAVQYATYEIFDKKSQGCYNRPMLKMWTDPQLKRYC